MAAHSHRHCQGKMYCLMMELSLVFTAGVGKGTPKLADVTFMGASTSADVINKGHSIYDNVAGKDVSSNGDITALESGEVDEPSTLDEDIAEITHASDGTTGNDSSGADNATDVCTETSGCWASYCDDLNICRHGIFWITLVSTLHRKCLTDGILSNSMSRKSPFYLLRI